MPKRFLNVEYFGARFRINVTDFEDVSEVQDAVKAKLANALSQFDAPQLQFYLQQGQHISKWASFNSLHQEYFDEEGPCLLIRTIPPIRELSSSAEEPRKRRHIEISDLKSFSSAEEHQHVEISDLNLKSFANAQLVQGCIQSQDQAFLPYPQDEIRKLYVRKCYQDVFGLLIQHISMNSFAISGTPGNLSILKLSLIP
jgi:hypothetical protein